MAPTYRPLKPTRHHASWKQPFKADTTWSLTNQPTKKHKSIKQNKPNKNIVRTKNYQRWIIHKLHRKQKIDNPTSVGTTPPWWPKPIKARSNFTLFWRRFRTQGGGDPKSEMLGFFGFQKDREFTTIKDMYHVYIQKSYIIRILPDHFWKKGIYNPLPILDPWDGMIYLLMHH